MRRAALSLRSRSHDRKPVKPSLIRLALVVLLNIATALACAAQQPPAKMVNQDVIDMASLGLSDEVLVDKIHAASATDFDTTLEGLKVLKAAKVSDNVIRAMINPGTPAVPAPAASTAFAKADPNDPSDPHDPGIYMYTKTRDGVKMIMLEPTVYTQGKMSGAFTSAMTYGAAKMKWKAIVRGSHANMKTADSGTVFYFYFEKLGAGLSYGAFGGTSTPNEYTLLRFDDKKDSRETVVMKGSMWGTSSGTDKKADTGFTFEKLQPGVYKVTPNTPLKAGEYCFIGASGGGAFAAGAAGANRLFDFGISRPD
jgi:hypothetical protein